MQTTNVIANLNAEYLGGRTVDDILGFDLELDLSGEDTFLIGKPVPSPSDLSVIEADYGEGHEHIQALVTECFGKPGSVQTPKEAIIDGNLDYDSVRDYIEHISTETGAERWTLEQHTIVLGEVEYQMYVRDSYDPESGDEGKAVYGLVDASISEDFLTKHTLLDYGDMWCPFTFLLGQDYQHCYDCRIRDQAFRCLIYVE